MYRNKILTLIDEYQARYPDEADAERLRRFVDRQPRCFERDCFDDGHVTGAAWLLDGSGSRVLLTHHRKLGKWLQLGGHSDGDNDPLAVACREAEEESGLSVRPVDSKVLDIHVHIFPAQGRDPPVASIIGRQMVDARYVARPQGRCMSVGGDGMNFDAAAPKRPNDGEKTARIVAENQHSVFR